MSRPFDLARELAEDGLSVIPVGCMKEPTIEEWGPFQSRAPTLAELERWQEGGPPAWAVVTGAVSGYVVLDFDRPKGAGEPDGLDLLRNLGLPGHVITPSGGRHVYVEHPGERVQNRAWRSEGGVPTAWGERWPGMDVRGDGGYVVILGRVAGGGYFWTPDFEAGAIVGWDELPVELRDDLLGRGRARRIGRTGQRRRASFAEPRPIRERSACGGRLPLAELMADALELDGYRNERGRQFARLALEEGYAEEEIAETAEEFATAATLADPSDHDYEPERFLSTLAASARKRHRLAALGDALLDRAAADGLPGSAVACLAALLDLALELWQSDELELSKREHALRAGVSDRSAHDARGLLRERGYVEWVGRSTRGADVFRLVRPAGPSSPLRTPLDNQTLPTLGAGLTRLVREHDIFRHGYVGGKGVLATYLVLLGTGRPLSVEGIAASPGTRTAQTIRRYHLPSLIGVGLVVEEAAGLYSAPNDHLPDRLDRAADLVGATGAACRQRRRQTDERERYLMSDERRAERLTIGRRPPQVEVPLDGVNDDDQDRQYQADAIHTSA